MQVVRNELADSLNDSFKKRLDKFHRYFIIIVMTVFTSSSVMAG